MGIFSNIFGSSSNIEKKLEEKYVTKFMMGMLPSEARDFFRDLLREAKKEMMQEETQKGPLPQNCGDLFLEKESTDPQARVRLTQLRNENVRDEDIRWWWNMHDLERRVMSKVEDVLKLAQMHQLIEEEGLGADEAALKVRNINPIFGDHTDTTQMKGNNRCLPEELRNRVNKYIEKREMSDPQKFKNDIEESSSFNALIREELRKGNL